MAAARLFLPLSTWQGPPRRLWGGGGRGRQALPSEQAAEWSEREEIQDLYSIYIGREHSPEKQSEVRTILGIGEDEARRLADLVQSGSFQLEEEAEEGALF